MTNTTDLTHPTFLAEAAEAATQNDAIADAHFDGDIAWEHYSADPARWSEATQDNPEGNPVLAMVLAAGPWWV